MKLLSEVGIIFGIYFIGEGIAIFTGLPIPGNLIGMIILLALLCLRIIKLESISSIANFLLGYLPFFFIPAGVALMSSFVLVKDIWLQILIVCVVTTFITMGVSGWCVERFMRKKGEQ